MYATLRSRRLSAPIAAHYARHVESWDGAGLGIQLLGAFGVRVDGAPVPDAAWRLRRAKSLVKLLALAPERRLHREQVVELLWPGGDPAGSGLHQVLYTARRALGAGEHLVLRDDVVALVGDDVRVDVHAFELATEAARDDRTIDAYRAALGLYAGELLPEDRYEDWTAARRESLRETYLALFVELSDLEVAAGDVSGAIATLQRAVVEDPLHERAHRALMRVFADDGRRQQALAQYQMLREALRRELAADPDPETSRLYREVLAAQHEPPPSPSLPQQLTSFVGRERELAELVGLLRHTRLLTLTGPGGCGKTRLAVELAGRVQGDFAAGVRIVELAPIADPALVVEETAIALGLQPRSDRDACELLAEHIGTQRLLVVLDNCEHLIDACAQMVDRLLRACPELRVLATSRERLRIHGEVSWRVPSLSLPDPALDPAELERSEAVRLFCQRAADAAPGFALTPDNVEAVAEICRSLDGMPLALELAAARAAALSPAQIAERLSDALTLLQAGSRAGLTRQQTLRATLAWSHDLLSEPERVLYRRLGAFAGSFGVEAVEGICAGDEVDASEALDLLVRLVDKSLVQVEPTRFGHRYRLLETVRQDARARIGEAGERDRIEAAHRAWYLALAEAADRDIDPGAAVTWPAERVELEHDDLRTALAGAIRHDPPKALRLATATWWWWMARGYFAEGARWFDAALAAAPEPTLQRARALVALGGIEVRRSHPVPVVALGSEALDIVRRGGDRVAEARALERLGVMALGGYDWEVADRALAEGLALATEVGDDPVVVAVRQARAVRLGCVGENAEARGLLDEALALLEEIPDERGPVFWAMHISPVVIPAGPRGAPRAFFEDTYCLFRAVRSRAATGYLLCNVAETWRADGELARAREALDRALERFRTLDDEPGVGVALNALGSLARSTGEFDAGREWFDEALALRRAAGDAREMAMTLMGMGMLALHAGERDEGGRLIEEAHAIYVRIDDGPGIQGVPLNLGTFELDHGDAERACALLERCVEVCRVQGMARHRGWASAELAEAAIAVGHGARAEPAIDDAVALFEAAGDRRGIRRVAQLRERLGALTAAD
jgi:predicted ATPase/DNA-binding SARP family transcriptional activator